MWLKIGNSRKPPTVVRICIPLIFFIRPKKKICVFPVTRPTLFFPSDPKVFIGIPKKNEILSCATYPICGHSIGFATFAVIFEAVLLFKHLF